MGPIKAVRHFYPHPVFFWLLFLPSSFNDSTQDAPVSVEDFQQENDSGQVPGEPGGPDLSGDFEWGRWVRHSKLVRVYFSPKPQLCFSALYVSRKEPLAIVLAHKLWYHFYKSVSKNIQCSAFLISKCYSGSSVGPLLHDCYWEIKYVCIFFSDWHQKIDVGSCLNET